MEKLGVGIIGYGYWGPNLARNFAESSAFDLLHISDLRQRNLDSAKKRYPAITASSNVEAMLTDRNVHAVAIATPTTTHFDLAMSALRAGKHVLVEKPITPTSELARLLTAEADSRGLTLMVDHTFVYTSAVQRMRMLVEQGEVGDVLYYDSVRINLGLFQHDVDVIWDLAVHDVSILTYLLDERVVAVSAQGKSHVSGQPMNIAFLTLFYSGNMIAHVNVNWLAPVKIRRTVIGGSKKMIVYDDLEPTEKIKIYDKGVTLTSDPGKIMEMRVGYRIGDMWAPNLPAHEALSNSVAHFGDCIQKGLSPLTNGGKAGLIVRILEAASQSADLQGRPIPLTEG